MIEEKLKQASQQESARRSRLFVTLLCIFVPLGLFFLGIVRFDLSPLGVTPEREAAAPAATAELAPAAGGVVSTSDTVTQARPKAGAAYIEGAQIVAGTAAPDVASLELGRVGGQVSNEDSERAREAFRAALAAFESDVEPDVVSDAFAAWNSDSQSAILGAKNEAVSLYGSGRYGDALVKLKTGMSQANDQLNAREDAFETSFGLALAAYQGDDHFTAGRHIAEALRIDPESQSAISLKSQVDQLPDLLAAMRLADIARIENDPADEAVHLRAAVALAPDRAQLQTRLREIEGEVKEERFAQHIRSGLENVRAGRLSAARADLDAANAVFAGRPEAKVLAQRIAGIASASSFEQLIAQAKREAEADNWQRAKQILEQARAVRPQDMEMNTLLRRANEINGVTQAIDRHNRKPQRLAAENVEAAARAQLAKAKALTGQSPTLARSSEALEANLQRYTAEIPIRVVSDGATVIKVRGVGRIGAVTDGTVALRPGRYLFEGKRPGFRSKLVEVAVAPGDANLRVDIRCDEPL